VPDQGIPSTTGRRGGCERSTGVVPRWAVPSLGDAASRTGHTRQKVWCRGEGAMDIRSSGGVRGRDASAKDARGRVWMDAPSTGAIGTPCARMPSRVPLALASLEPRVVRTPPAQVTLRACPECAGRGNHDKSTPESATVNAPTGPYIGSTPRKSTSVKIVSRKYLCQSTGRVPVVPPKVPPPKYR
jgi:hypothetical protein